MNRMPIPPLIRRTPECPLCDGDAVFEDDGWVCPSCKVSWSNDFDSPGSTEDWEASPQCAAEAAPFDEQQTYPSLHGQRYRCVRERGHDIPDPEKESRGRTLWHVGIRVDRDVPEIYTTYEWPPKR